MCMSALDSDPPENMLGKIVFLGKNAYVYRNRIEFQKPYMGIWILNKEP